MGSIGIGSLKGESIAEEMGVEYQYGEYRARVVEMGSVEEGVGPLGSRDEFCNWKESLR